MNVIFLFSPVDLYASGSAGFVFCLATNFITYSAHVCGQSDE